MRHQSAFSNKESAVLIAIYEDPGIPFDSYTLVGTMNPDVKPQAPAFNIAFAAILKATEDLISRGFVRGTRLKGSDGIYFSRLKLTYKGEPAAIQERRRIAEFKESLPELIKESDRVVKEMKKK